VSGGSFDYACYDVWDLNKAQSLHGKLMDMRGRLLTSHPDVIPYLSEMIEYINHIVAEYDEKGRRIYELLYAIEWFYSGDTDEEGITKALEELKVSHPLPAVTIPNPLMESLIARLEALESKLDV
jgi:hypothetical protein